MDNRAEGKGGSIMIFCRKIVVSQYLEKIKSNPSVFEKNSGIEKCYA